MLKKIFPKSTIACFIFVIILCSCAAKKDKKSIENNQWKTMQDVIDLVKEPTFPNKNYNVSNFGAIADGKFDNTQVFNNLIKTCSENGGGIIIIPAGKYFTGAIQFESNINLHLEEGAEILFSTNPIDYPIVLTSFEGTEMMNYSPLIYANKKNNIAITGSGTLNGQANNENWWAWCGKEEYGWKKGAPIQNVKRLMDFAEEGVAVSDRVFGNGYFLRPSFVEFLDCENVMLKNIKIVNAPFWIIHPIKCNKVLIDGVFIKSHGPNNDGCDPEYSKNVVISNCSFDTGDDCIAIKSGRDADGRRVAISSENIVVQKCKMYDGHGGVTIGSEISAGVKNVFVDNCEMDSPNLDRAIRIKTNTRRGGTVENIFVRNLKIGQVKESVLGIDMFYSIHGNQTGNFIPVVKNIFLEDITVKNGGKYGVLAKGLKSSPIKNIVFKNITIDQVETKYSVENVENLQFYNTKMNGNLINNPSN